MCAMDVQDAYFHIPIIKKHRKFLRFMIGSHHYQFKVLPFCLKFVPRTFTKCMAVANAHLHKRKFFVYLYLDDWLITSSPVIAR